MAGRSVVVAIDGPAAVGKSTVSRAVAKRLGFSYLDSGRMYRLVGFAAAQAGADLASEDEVLAAAQPLLDDPDAFVQALAREELSGEQAGTAASLVSKLPGVRAALLDAQRDCAGADGLVADGRDMGTVIFPDAALKIFLVASAQEREKRFKDRETGLQGSRMHDSVAAFRERDQRDNQRRIAPVEPADDAVVVDSGSRSVEEVVAEIVALYLRATGGASDGNTTT